MVVLHDRANAVCRGTWPRSKLSSLGICLPSMFSVPGQLTTLSGVTCAGLQRGRHRHRLERRSGRVQAGQRDRALRVGRRVLCDGQQVARRRLDRHDRRRGGQRGQRVLGGALHADVQRAGDVTDGLGVLPADPFRACGRLRGHRPTARGIRALLPQLRQTRQRG